MLLCLYYLCRPIPKRMNKRLPINGLENQSRMVTSQKISWKDSDGTHSYIPTELMFPHYYKINNLHQVGKISNSVVDEYGYVKTLH